MSKSIHGAEHSFGDSFIQGAVFGHVLVMEEYLPDNPLPWTIPFRKLDNHHVVLFVFETSEDAESELKLFPKNMAMRVEKISSNVILKYLRIMNEMVSGSALAFTRDRNKNFEALGLQDDQKYNNRPRLGDE